MMPGKQRITYNQAPPAAVEQVLAQLGRNIATARLRRQWRQADLAQKAGITRATLIAVEHGRVGTGIGAYAAALWALGMHDQLGQVAAPDRDVEGVTLEAARLGTRARPSTRLDDEF